mmetsp:Transcript_328/g.654  ORF Transcript_328/g.654 Transcript_328/m.654 type:complete len:200 (+) Transcript_328:523-1122(+)
MRPWPRRSWPRRRPERTTKTMEARREVGGNGYRLMICQKRMNGVSISGTNGLVEMMADGEDKEEPLEPKAKQAKGKKQNGLKMKMKIPKITMKKWEKLWRPLRRLRQNMCQGKTIWTMKGETNWAISWKSSLRLLPLMRHGRWNPHLIQPKDNYHLLPYRRLLHLLSPWQTNNPTLPLKPKPPAFQYGTTHPIQPTKPF